MNKAVALFCTLMFACSCSTYGNYVNDDLDVATAINSSKNPKGQMFNFLFEEAAPPPKAECVKGGQKCVAHYVFNDEVSRESVRLATGWLKSVKNIKASSIVIEINSPGGSVNAGFDLVKEIESSQIPVTCIVDSQAYSMASYILESCDQRMMTKRSSLMIHRAAVGGSMYGQADDWQNIAESLKATDEALLQFYLEKMDVAEDLLKEKTQGSRQWWLNYKDALKYEAIDRVVKTVKEVIKEYQN